MCSLVILTLGNIFIEQEKLFQFFAQQDSYSLPLSEIERLIFRLKKIKFADFFQSSSKLKTLPILVLWHCRE